MIGVQLAGAVKHPEEGKIIDMSEAAKVEYNVEDAYLEIISNIRIW